MSGGPETIGGYELEERIGAGSCATVYRARRGAEVVALKLVHPHLARNPVVRARFVREVAIGRRLIHPSIVRVHDLVAWEGHLALVMELCAGSLSGWRASGAAELIRVATEIAEGLREAHARGIVHRDLKPQNVLRDAGGRCKLCDFGSAGVAESASLTTSSLLVTAPFYVAPEIFQGQPADPRADLYSLGAILYESLTGKPARVRALPLGGESGQPDRSSLDAELPGWLVEIVLGLLAPVDRRIGDAGTLLRALRAGAPIPGIELKSCLFCGAAIPAASPLCLSCGEEELALRPALENDACFLSLRKVSEEAGTLQELTEILRAVSGDRRFELNLLIGDARMYSREEQKLKVRLPVRLIDGLSGADAERLRRVLDRLKVRTRVQPMRQARWVKRGPLVRAKGGAVVVEAATELLRQGSAVVPSLADPWTRSLASTILYSVYRLETLASSHELRDVLRDPLLELRRDAERCIRELDSSRSALAGVDRAELYAVVARAELEGREDLAGERARALEALERCDSAELARSRVAARMLRVAALTDELSGILSTAGRPKGAEAGSMAVAVAELEAALAAPQEAPRGEPLGPPLGAPLGAPLLPEGPVKA